MIIYLLSIIRHGKKEMQLMRGDGREGLCIMTSIRVWISLLNKKYEKQLRNMKRTRVYNSESQANYHAFNSQFRVPVVAPALLA